MMKPIFLFFLALSVAGSASAQHNHFCGSDLMNRENFERHPELLQYKYLLDSLTQKRIREHHGIGTAEKRANPYIIPIVFHIVHNYGPENITDAQIYDQVRILNEDFRRLNADYANTIPEFRDKAADSEIEFRLATVDPKRNCTSGINRYQSLLTYQGSDDSKLNPWPRDLYLNVWIVNRIARDNSVKGYAYLPSGAEGLRGLVDGIILVHDFTGSTGTSTLSNSHTLSHEVGHYLNLNHTWGGGQVATACGDDGIFDTPITKGSQGCDLKKNDCSVRTITSSYKFDDVTPSSGTSTPSGFDSTGVEFSDFSALGVSSNPTDSARFVFSGWDTGGEVIDGDSNYALLTETINTSKYYEVTIAPVFGNNYTITGIIFNVQRSATGPRTYVVRSSANGYSTNLSASIVPANSNLQVQSGNVFFFRKDTATMQVGTKITLPSNDVNYVRSSGSLTFRIYAWNAESDTGDFSVDDLSITGTYGIIENVQNIMDYSFCYTMFTNGQKAAMQTALNSDVSSRNSLWSDATLEFTGANVSTNENTCPPVADFNSTQKMVCVGTSVDFRDYSWRGPIDAWEWQFSNATPALSTDRNPTVQFNAPGWQSVTLKVTGALGESVKTLEKFIFVTDDQAAITRSFSEDFENSGAFENDWIVYNHDNNASKFQWTGSASYSGGGSLHLNTFDVSLPDGDAVITPAFDVANSGSSQLKFKYSLASRAINGDDVDDNLTITYSVNCGRTWSAAPIFNQSGADLITAGSYTGKFVPDREVLWKEVAINLPSGATASSNVRFRFEFTSGEFSNNLYIDDINVANLYTSLTNPNNSISSLNVYPVPSTGEFNVGIMVKQPAELRMDLHDIFGKNILTRIQEVQGGLNTLPVNLDLSSGVYTLSITIDGERLMRKISIMR